MPVTLRKRVQCHYCGNRLKASRREHNKITCDGCLADNYFDESGNITDVPTEETSRSVPNGSAVREVTSQSDVFCSTCLKNQHMYITALSDYLPDTDDPKYAQIEAGLPEFKRQLELRFPQCCAQCEPRVKERLRQANYAAKSDHLRRVLQRNHKRNEGNRLGWRSLVVTGAGIGYLVAVGVQLVWHTFSSLAESTYFEDDVTLRQCFTTYPIPRQCGENLRSSIPFSFLLTLLCFWWNPKWQDRLKGREGRLVGLAAYYKFQAFILILRFAAWIVTTDVPAFGGIRRELHVISLITIAIFTVWSVLGLVSVDTTPLVNWQQDDRPLVHPEQFVPPTRPDQHVDPAPVPQSSGTFPLESLANTRQAPSDPWRPPTPPVDEDSMDWTPSQESFMPRTRKHVQKPIQPSPFYGKLPAVPSRGQSVKDASSAHKHGIQGIQPGFFGSRKSLPNHQQFADDANSHLSDMPGPRFFPEASRFETGLENLFGNTFSLSKNYDEVDKGGDGESANDIFGRRKNGFAQHKSASSKQGNLLTANVRFSWTARNIFSACAVFCLGIIAASLCTVDYLYASVSFAPSKILPYMAVIPGLHLADGMIVSSRVNLLSVGWLTTLALVTGSANLTMPESGSQLVPMWNKLVVGIVCLLLVQELFYLCCSDGVKMSQAAQAQMAQSIARAEQMEQDQASQPPPFTESPANFNLATSNAELSSPRSTQKNGLQVSQWEPNRPLLGRRDSDESLSSVSSIKTSSTASGWQTPPHNNRRLGSQPSSATSSRFGDSSAHRMGALSLGNDFTTGSSIAGPRDRRNMPSAFTGYR